MQEAQLAPTGEIIADGVLHRFDVEGDRRGSGNGFYKLHLDDPPSGYYGSWKTGAEYTWTLKRDKPLTAEEKKRQAARIAADRKARDEEASRVRAEAAKLAKTLWSNANVDTNFHPYLLRKQIKPGPARLGGAQTDQLVLPVITPAGDLVSLQFISPDGTKRFLTGGQVQGCYCPIGRSTDVLLICEGFATGMSLHEATGYTAICAFNAGNLEPVAKAMRGKYPNARIVICADDDQWTRDGNPGREAASDASLAAGGVAITYPDFQHDHPERPTDFNDVARLEGLQRVKFYVEQALSPEPPTDHTITLPPGIEIDAEKIPPPDLQNDPARIAETPSAELIEPGRDPIAIEEIRNELPHLRGKERKPVATIQNLQAILQHLHVQARYNVISKEEELLIPGEGFSIDNRANASLSWLVSQCNLIGMPVDRVSDFLTYLADKNPYNPVLTWITSKPWDGRTRLPELYRTITAVGEQDPKVRELKETLLRRWLISAAAAASLPEGIAAQGMLVLQGAQYLGKTEWFKRLVPRDLAVIKSGSTLKTDDKDSVKQVISYWLVELGELDATFRKSDIAALKAFITRDRDDLRLPYARKKSDFARRTVFFGSVNDKEFLHDTSGNRRFWTIECEAIHARHEIDMQQLWAEVLTIYREWEKSDSEQKPWFLTTDELKALNESNLNYMILDPIEERIGAFLDWGSKMGWHERTATQILADIGIDRPTKADVTRAGQILRARGCDSKRGTHGARVVKAPPRKILSSVD